VIDGKMRHLYRRRFCLKCSPFNIHNTSKFPPGSLLPDQLREHRRKRKNASTYRYQKERRKRLKQKLIESRGGRCEGCGYYTCLPALEFHHRDGATKSFGIGNFSCSWDALVAEASKCDLLCPNCHRERHAAQDLLIDVDPLITKRRAAKVRAVEYMGGHCYLCGCTGLPAIFEFHHRRAREKTFGISHTGAVHVWQTVVAELAKCVMLCANCHREVHAGVRELEDEALLGLAEGPGDYARTVARMSLAA
jgi:hypothetical protein